MNNIIKKYPDGNFRFARRLTPRGEMPRASLRLNASTLGMYIFIYHIQRTIPTTRRCLLLVAICTAALLGCVGSSAPCGQTPGYCDANRCLLGTRTRPYFIQSTHLAFSGRMIELKESTRRRMGSPILGHAAEKNRIFYHLFSITFIYVTR
jgi:hypothetical protein